MKILYFVDQSINSNISILEKIKAQIASWKNYGVNVKIFSFADKALYSVSRFASCNTVFDLVEKFNDLTLRPWKIIEVFRKIDYHLVYTRWKIFRPFLISSFLTNNRGYILEINSNDIIELWLENKVKYIYNYTTRNFLLKNAKGLICVTNELVEKFKQINSNSICVSNGIDVFSFPFIANTNNKKPNIVFIGSPDKHSHGLDKIVLMSKLLKSCIFHIIGINGKNTDNLIYHGFLSLEESNNIVKKADFGISSLSLYKKKMLEACPLKSRQYLAMGIPIIYAYNDPDLQNDYLFALKLPNSKDNVISNIKLIRKFIVERFKDQKIRIMARKFAEEKLDLTKKERIRVEFMKKNCLNKENNL